MVSQKDKDRADGVIKTMTDFMGRHPKTTLVIFAAIVVVIVILAIRF